MIEISQVYIVEAQNNVAKIGKSVSPRHRALSVCACNSVPARLIAILDGSAYDEAELHKRFNAYRSHGEWFRIDGQFADFVSSVRGTGVDRIFEWAELTFDQKSKRLGGGKINRSIAQKLVWADPEYRARRAAGRLQAIFDTQRGLRLRIAKELGITHGAVSQWRRVPADRVLEVERLTGVSRHVLRPDIYPPAPSQSEGAAA